MAADPVLPVVRHHLAVFFAVVPARKIEVIEREVDAEFRRRRLHHPDALGHDFLADAVTGDHRDSFPVHRQLLFCFKNYKARSGSAAGSYFRDRTPAPRTTRLTPSAARAKPAIVEAVI